MTSPVFQTPLDTPDFVDALDDYILFTDAEGVVVGANSKALSYFADQSTNVPFWELYELDIANMDEALEKLCPEKTHEITGTSDTETFSLRIIPLPRTLSPYGGYVITATDFHPIIEIQEQLEDNLVAWDDTIALLNSLFDSAKDPIILVNSKYEVISANKRATKLFFNVTSLPDKQDCRKLIAESALPVFENGFRKVSPEAPWSQAISVRPHSGEEIPVEIVMRRVQLSSFSLVQIAMRDVSKRVQLQEDLDLMTTEVEDMSTTLKQVIRTVAEEKQEMKEELVQQVMEQMLPAIDRIAEEDSSDIRQSYKSVIEDQITDFMDGTSSSLDAVVLKLTPREIEICRLILLGRKTREIAELLTISFETLQTHRKNIRRKLGLKGRRISLFSYLQQSDLS